MSTSKEKLELTVTTQDETADVYVIDGNFRTIGKGRGLRSTFILKPGIYTVKARVGFENREENVVLMGGPQTIAFDTIEFRSAIPLLNTARTHEYHIEAAERESRKIHRKIGDGAFIFIFAREWTPPNASPEESSTISSTDLPHQGIVLKGADDKPLVELETAAVTDSVMDAWAACNIEVDPGTYRISVEVAPDKTVEQTIVACRGWQTQVFYLQRDYDCTTDAERRADLSNTGILMTKASRVTARKIDSGFTAADPKMRLLDLARLGLANNRVILTTDAMNKILYGKFQNPMLGILGGHLLLKQTKPNLSTLKIVVKNLRRILGKGTHPDVEALALRSDQKDAKYDFALPPMLRQSWLQVVHASKRDPGLVPTDSFAGKIASRIVNDEPWLLYFGNEEKATVAEGIENSLRYLVEQSLAAASASASIVTQVMASVPTTQELIEMATDVETQAVSKSVELGNRVVNQIVDTMALPKAQVIELIDQLDHKPS